MKKQAWITRGKFRFQLMALCCSLLSVASSHADIFINTLSSFAGTSIDSFGDLAGDNPGGTTYGETFNTGTSDALAKDISFLVRPYYPYIASAPCTFQVCLMAWNGERPVGPILFASTPQTTTGSFFSFQQFDVPLDNTSLMQGQEYVAFFTADNYLNGIRADAAMGATGDLYSGGTYVAHGGESSFNDLLTTDWSTPFNNTYDLAFNLDLQLVPEPSALSFLALSAVALVLRRLD
jgi:hypothetical protein